MLMWQDLGSPRRHASGTPGRDCLDLANHRACLWRILLIRFMGWGSVGSSGAGASEWKGESKVKQAFVCLCLIVDSVWPAAVTSLSRWTVPWSWSEHRHRHWDCWNRIESPEIHPHSYSHLVFNCQNILGKRATSSAHSAGETDSSQWKNEISLCMKIHSRWIKGFNEDLKLPDENVDKNTSKQIQGLSAETPTAQIIILRLDQQCYMKCRSKRNHQKSRAGYRIGEHLHQLHIQQEGHRTYKEWQRYIPSSLYQANEGNRKFSKEEHSEWQGPGTVLQILSFREVQSEYQHQGRKWQAELARMWGKNHLYIADGTIA